MVMTSLGCVAPLTIFAKPGDISVVGGAGAVVYTLNYEP